MSRSETRLHIVDFSETESRRYSMKRKSGGARMFFPLYTGVVPPIYVPTTSFKLTALWNIMVEAALLSKSASVTKKQKSHPV